MSFELQNTRTAIGLLLAIGVGLAAAVHVYAQMPPLPQLGDVVVEARAAAQPGSDILSYEYRVRHLGSSLLVNGLSLDVSSDPSRAVLDASGLAFAEPFFRRSTQLNLSELGPEKVVVAVATASPAGWAAGIDADARLSWGPTRDDALIAPGGSASFGAASRGLPVIRSMSIRPDIFDFLPNFDEIDVTLEEYHTATEASNLVVPTIGPQGPPAVLDLAAFAAEIVGLRHEAGTHGWVRAGPDVQQVDALLGEMQLALEAGELGAARSLVTALLALVESISCATLDCPTDVPVTSEGRALLAINLDFLRSRLPANAPPVADAGPDRVFECSSPAETAVQLDGSASSDPDGDPLSFLWTGPFGEASGATPVVTVPLGASEIGLVVSDGQLESDEDFVSVVSAVTVAGFEPPLEALVPESEEPAVPDKAFKQGRTLPLKLQLSCVGLLLDEALVAAPMIAAIEREGEALDLPTLDLDAGQSNEGGTAFRFSEGKWIYNLSTRDLATGTYRLLVETPDGLRHASALVLR